MSREFIADVVEHSSSRPCQTSDLIFEFFDGHFEAGQFDACNAALASLTPLVGSISDVAAVSVLAVTEPAKDSLPARPAFVEAVHAALVRSIGEAEATDVIESYR